MLRKRRTEATKVYVVVAVLFAFCLAQTAASPLKKDAGQDGQKEDATDTSSGYTKGVILFGVGPKHSEDTDYQADYSGYYKQFDNLSPSLLCGNSMMNFRTTGAQSRHFSLNPSYPLSRGPSSCRSNMNWTPFGFVLNVPFDGCELGVEDGSYILYLLWHRIPVSLKCPKPEDTTTAAPNLLPYFPIPFPFPTTAPTDPPQDPVPPLFPGFGPYNWWPIFPFYRFPYSSPHGPTYPWYPKPLYGSQYPWYPPQLPGFPKNPWNPFDSKDPTVSPTQSVQQPGQLPWLQQQQQQQWWPPLMTAKPTMAW